MVKALEGMLYEFRDCFSRTASFNCFVVLLLGLIIRFDHGGVTSIMRAFFIVPAYYTSLLHFFRADSWDAGTLMKRWTDIAHKYSTPLTIAGRCIYIGDGIKINRESQRMPGTKTLYQASEDITKPKYGFGHHFGVVGLLAGCSEKVFAIPLMAEIQEGMKNYRKMQGKTNPSTSDNKQKTSVITLMLQMVVNLVQHQKRPTTLVLDAYFVSRYTFQAAKQCVNDQGQRLLHVIVRGKSNAVGYLDPEPRKPGQRGPTPKYGKKLKLESLFTQRSHEFETVELNIYGELKTLSVLTLDLLWKPIGEQVRFVLVKDGSQRFMLMCSQLDWSAGDIITAYSLRFKIEVSFKNLKHIFGGFAYHFWTLAQPKITKKTPKAAQVEATNVTDEKQRALIARTLKAIEGFVNISCIALGFTQILSLNFAEEINRYESHWRRTVTSVIPTEEVTQAVLRTIVLNDLGGFRRSWIKRVINEKRMRRKSLTNPAA